MNEPIFLEPVFKERIWGGTKLREMFGYDIPSSKTGECWAVSAHQNGQSVVRSGRFKGKTLGQLWTEHQELFGSGSETFPLLIKILDASDDLSVQVHPDDEYANRYENRELGKTECWYILDCEREAEIILGHKAKSKDQLRELIRKGEWDQLLCKVQVKRGDFFYVPSGTIHAVGKGIVVLEAQQSSDTTYRVYDYDRRDAEGNLRELHLEKSIEVTNVPHVTAENRYDIKIINDNTITTLISNPFFTVQKWDVKSEITYEANETFTIFSVISGEGNLCTADRQFELKKGEHFILPANFGQVKITGQLSLITSSE